jgi:hypothetical protein
MGAVYVHWPHHTPTLAGARDEANFGLYHSWGSFPSRGASSGRLPSGKAACQPGAWTRAQQHCALLGEPSLCFGRHGGQCLLLTPGSWRPTQKEDVS